MGILPENDDLTSPAFERLRQFVRQQRQPWTTQANVANLEAFERELHQHMMELERELIAEELARYDVEAEAVEVEGTVYRYTLTSRETYLSAAGPVSVERHLYRPAGRSSKSICPLELRAGIIGGLFTPRAARQGAFVVAHLTPREAAALFSEIGGMNPSASSLDRLPKALSPHWEAQREAWEAALRATETVPTEATVLGLSLDGVMAPMKEAGRVEKRSQPDKQASGPAGYREVGCGTLSLYDAAGQRLVTIRYGRMPETKKTTLCAQLEAEAQSILALRPDLKIVKLADGAKENWRFLEHLDLGLSADQQGQADPPVSIVDFCHAADHLKKACDAIWPDDPVKSKAKFVCLRTLLKEKEGGVNLVIRSLKHHFSRARGSRRERIESELTYFRNQQPRMQYASYLKQGWPIASGVVEAACKTLVTQRMKRSGMAWGQDGGQAILTLRSLIQSNRWEPAWTLLSSDFRKLVKVVETRHDLLSSVQETLALPEARSDSRNIRSYHSLPLAV
jgi:hypothetical protein